MSRHPLLLAPALALLLASPFVLAQDTPPPPTQSAASVDRDGPQLRMAPAPTGRDHMGHGRMDRGRMGRWMEHGMRHGEGMGAMADLHALERLYREAGRERELTGIYNDVLAKSQDPRLRTYVYHQLARLQARPANVDQAIATLRKSLAENLANEAKMRAEHERMRAALDRIHAQGPTPAAQ